MRRLPYLSLLVPLLLPWACSDSSEEPPPPPVVPQEDGGVPPQEDGGEHDAGPDAEPEVDLNDGVLVIGKARFTVITPTLIRMEFDPDGHFVDLPSYFAVGRDLRYRRAAFTTTASGGSIDTGTLKLTYVDDGQPFSEANVTAEIQIGNTATTFSPASPNTMNLGGTTRTLDRWTGAGKLDDGILSKAGWYVLDDSSGHLLEDGWIKERPSSEKDWYLFGYGHDYKAALASLTAIGGAVPMPRRSALGTWYSRYWPYSAADYEAIVDEYDAHDFPLDVMVLDMDWHEDGWTGWSWNRPLIPDPAALLGFLHGRGIATTVNVHPADGVAPHEDAYAAFMTDLGKDPGQGETVPFDAADRAYMEALFSEIHAPLTDVGVDFFWLDWQQSEFTKGLPHLGNLPWLNELYYRYSSQSGARGLSFSRWGGFGDHRHPIHFSGDAATSFEMLAFEVPFTATSGNSGIFFWTHDIGGHVGDRNEESYARWCQFGAFSAALRSHSARDPNLDRRPWTYSDWAAASMKESFQLRSRFFPYLYSSVWQATAQSVPLLRPMYLEHPDLEEAYRQPQQYFFGDALLVAPVVEAGVGPSRLGRQVVWFPEGSFYDFFTGERFEGPGEHLVSATIDELPLYVRAGVPVPMQGFTRRMATTPSSELVIRCYPGAEGQSSSFVMYEDDGTTTANAGGASAKTTLTCARSGNDITVTVDPTTGTYDGQLSERSYVIEVPATSPSTSVSTNGVATTIEYSESEMTNRVHLAARAVREGVSVRIKAAPVDPAEIRKRAFAARVGMSSTTRSLEESIQAAWAAAPGDAEKLAVLAAAGTGVFPKNEEVYGYPNTPKLMSYSEPWTNATSDVSTAWVSIAQVQRATVTYQGETITFDGPILGIDFDRPGLDLATTAVATFSSLETGETIGIADRKVGGYPGARSEEWSTNRETAGAWATLTWSTPQTVAQVVLYDRINPNDQITGGELSFSDGTTVPVGALANEPGAGPNVIRFPARSATWVKFTVTAVSARTENIGLAEMAVYSAVD